MALIKVSSTRGDYALINLEQVAWATVEAGASGTASRVTLHMVDGATFSLRDAEAALALESMRAGPREPPDVWSGERSSPSLAQPGRPLRADLI